MQRKIQAEDRNFFTFERNVHLVQNLSSSSSFSEYGRGWAWRGGKVGNFPEKKKLFRKSRATCGQG